MRKISDATHIMETILGQVSSQYFDGQAEELIWYAKSLSMDPSKAGRLPTEAHIKNKFEKISDNIVWTSVRFFLDETYGSANYIVTENAKALDKNMNPITEVFEVKQRQEEVTSILVEVAMSEFSKGRKIAEEIIARVKAQIGEPQRPTTTARNYFSAPPLEALEIEAIRLERRLPLLSREEGRRLAELYELIRNKHEMDEEVASWES